MAQLSSPELGTQLLSTMSQQITLQTSAAAQQQPVVPAPVDARASWRQEKERADSCALERRYQLNVQQAKRVASLSTYLPEAILTASGDLVAYDYDNLLRL